jgi:putative glutamine amidotransferase
VRIALSLGADALKSEENDYIRALVAAGFSREEIVLIPPGTKPEGDFDGVVLAGGVDVDPARYGVDVPHPTVEVDRQRDSTEFAFFEAARRGSIPTLGICRGMQLLNVALGGTLHQDIPTEHPSDITHNVPGKVPERRDHSVEIRPGTKLADIAGAPTIQVNSRHHQGVERLAPGVAVSAVAPDGLVEAFSIERARGFNLCVQWHPEWRAATNPVSVRLLRAFGDACRVYRDRHKAPQPAEER